MKIYYHCTRAEFLNEILEYGLQPIRPLSRLIDGQTYKPEHSLPAVFVSTVPFKWMHWSQIMPDDSYCRGAMITLNGEGLRMVPDPSPNHDGDFAILEPITPDRFMEIVISKIDNPCNFEEFKFKDGIQDRVRLHPPKPE
jgi:hypothetical protein